MTTFNVTLILIFLVLMSSFSNNPVKTVFSIMALALMIFLSTAMMSQSFWFPSVFFLLFMGGILVMFLILSSLLPNQKMTKKEYLIWMFAPLLMMLVGGAGSTTSNLPWKTGMSQEMPEFLVTTMNLTFLTALIMVYFLTFISMILAEKTTLRLESCF